MALDKDLNVPPYFDDFDEAKRFHRILYRPSTAVQARELTQSQTILQNQIERFAKHVFKDGSIVEGVAITYYAKVPYISIDDSFTSNATLLPTDINSSYLITNSTDSNNAVRAVVRIAKNGLKVAHPNTNRFYLSYIYTGTDVSNNDVTEFYPGDTLYFYNSNQQKFATLDSNNLVDTIQTLQSNDVFNSNGYTYCVGVSDGIIYQKGFFTKVEPQLITVRDFSTNVTNYVVGFNTDEYIVDENQDPSLNDNALGYENENAPGAHRLKLVPKLVSKTKTDSVNNTSFFAIVEFDGNEPTEQKDTPKYNEIEKQFAVKTYEESGNYVVNPFNIETVISESNTQTFYYQVSPGVAYVRGYRVEKVGPTKIETPRAVTTQVAQNQLVTANFGNYVQCNEFLGSFDSETMEEVTLYDTAQKAISNYEGTSSTPKGSSVGKANIRAVMYDNGTKGTPQAIYLVYIFNIRMNSNKSFTSDVKSIYVNGTFGGSKADLVLENGVAVLKDATMNTLLFDTGLYGIKRLTNNTGIGDTTFNYTQIKSATLANNGTVSVSLDVAAAGASAERLTSTSGSVLSGNAIEPYNIFLTANAYTANLTGSVSVTASNTTITGSSSAFTTDLSANNLIRIAANSTQTYVRRITSIANSTSLTIDVAIPQTNASTKIQKYFVTGTPLPLQYVTINSNTSFTANLNLTLDSGSQNVYCSFPVNRNQAIAIPKIINKNRFVKIDCSNNSANTVGPWNLGLSDVHKIRHIYVGTTYANTNTDGAAWFDLDTGQSDEIYDHSKLRILPQYAGQISASTKLLVELDHFTANTSASVGFFSVESYPIDDANTANTNAIQTIELPIYNKKELRNYIDFRPLKANTAVSSSTIAGASINPATSANVFSIPSSGQHLIIPDSNFEADIEYYLPRIDVISVDPYGTFNVNKGIPSTSPKPPFVESDQIPIAECFVPAYPSATKREFEVYKNIPSTKVSIKQNRRYTMRDIGTLDERIKRVEYYTVLNTVEQQARDLTIPDANGLNRFKNGIFADPFNSHNIGNVSDFEYKIAIDSDNSVARPYFDKHDIDFQYVSSNSTNIQVTGPILTLPYSSEVFNRQRFTTKYRNTTQSLWKWNGFVDLHPSSDFFRDESTAPNINLGLDLAAPWEAFKNSPFGAIYGDWRNISSQVSTQSSTAINGYQQTTATTTTTSTTQEKVITQLGVNTINERLDFGTYVKDVGIQPYMRERLVAFVAKNMKPNTTLHAFFDDVNVDQHCAPGTLSGLTEVPVGQEDRIVNKKGNFGDALVSDSKGFVCGIFRIPAKTFRTGDRYFQITNIDDLTLGNDARMTTGKSRFTADNVSITKQSTTLNVRQPLIFSKNISETRTTTSSSTVVTTVDLTPPFSGGDGGGGSSGDGGGSGDCFVAGTLVTLADGIKVDIQSIKVGDKLKGKDGINTVLEIDKPLLQKVSKPCYLYGINGSVPFVTSEHPFLTKNGWKSVSPSETSRLKPLLAHLNVTKLEIGDLILKENGSYEEVKSIEEYPNQPHQTLYNFRLDGDNCYYVNGLLVHNKPIAQSFSVQNVPDTVSGVFLSKVGVYFKTKDPQLGCTLFICEMTNNFPDMTKVLGKSDLESSQILVSDNGSLETVFTLDYPVYLLKNNDYCFVVQPVAYSPEYSIWVAETGDIDVITREQVYANPSTGTLFYSGNKKTWTDVQLEDIKFNLYRARFTSSTGTAIFKNEDDEYISINGLSKANTSLAISIGDIVYSVNSSANVANVASIVSNTRISNSTNGFPAARVQYFDEATGTIWLDSSNGGFSNTTNRTIAIYHTSDYTNTSLIAANTIVAYANVATINNLKYHAVVPKFGVMQPLKTSVSFDIKGTKSSGYTVESDYQSVLNEHEYEYIDNERYVVSKSNEVSSMSSNKSTTFKLSLESTSDFVSPVIDLSRKSMLFIENIINNDVTNEHTRYGNAVTKYVSKKVVLADGQEAEDLKVYLTAYRPADSDVKIYAKFWNGLDSEKFDDKVWTLMQYDNGGDLVYSSPTNTKDYIEYEFSVPSTNAVNYGAFSNNGTITYNTLAGGITITSSCTAITAYAHSFNANTGVNNINDTLAITNANTYFRVNDYVTYYTAAGNTVISGLSNNTTYYVTFSNASHIALSASRTGANVDLTASTTSETGHYITGTRFLEGFAIGDRVRVQSSDYYAIRTIVSIANNTYMTVDQGLEQTNSASIYYVLNKGGGDGIVEYYNTTDSRFIGYKEFAIKIVLLTSNPVHVPRLNDVRAIALQV